MVFGTVWYRRLLAAGALLAALVMAVTGVAASGAHAASRRGTSGSAGKAGRASPGSGRPAFSSGRPASRRTRRVSYRGYEFAVPRSWAVIDLAAHPATCVRFNRHALYLGRPGPNQSCPPALVGATGAVLVQPAAATAASRSTEDPVAHRITVTAARIRVTASYRGDRGETLAILASAGLPPPVRLNPAAMAQAQARSVPALSSDATNGTGLGFDACAAPSARAMNAWLRHSRYQAIGIYIGGSDRGCAQPNLTAAWVSQQAAAGWHYVPLYVGPQIAFHGEVTAPASQAASAAQDAVVQAGLLGFGPGSPIYYDMEAYDPSRSHAALTFFSAWTTTLHSLGYRSGIYSSSSSGITDLANTYNGGVYAMPDVIDDALWNGAANTDDPNVPPGDWANHQRVHQFSGNVTQTHGGFTINIDQDFLDVQLGGSGGGGSVTPTRQASGAVATPHGGVDAFFAGADGALWLATYRPPAGWAAPVRLGGVLTSQPSAVTVAGGTVEVFYRGADGGLRVVSQTARGWSGSQALHMGRLGGAPVAVSGSEGDIQVFWRGRDPANLWGTRFLPGSGWRGPAHLASGVAAGPSPVVSGLDSIGVFWKGSDGQLWEMARGAGHTWHRSAVLPVGQRASAPEATGLRNGQIDVFWGGTARGSIWHATFSPAGGWGARSLLVLGRRGDPFLVASSPSSAEAFWRGRRGRLWHAIGHSRGGWSGTGSLPMGKIGGGIFAASRGNRSIDVFWKGAGIPRLWHARYHPGTGSWSGPDDLGGRIGPG